MTQDVFITAFNQLRDPAAEPVRKLKPWLYRVATNACYNHLRSRKHLDGGGDAQLENAAAGVDEYQRAETVALVEASLGQLNERYRTALVLKDLQGLEPAEIAEVMEVSRPNADVLVHRARASFKAAFAKLAGDVPAPAALGMVLLPLSLPAALQAMPSFAHPAAPPAHAPAPHAPVGHGVHIPGLSHAGPAGARRAARQDRRRADHEDRHHCRRRDARDRRHGGGQGSAALARAPVDGLARPRLAGAFLEVEQALGPLEPLRAVDEARLADGLELRTLVLERTHGRLVLEHGQRLQVVERRHDERQLELGRRQLDDDHEPLGQLGLVLGRQLERLRSSKMSGSGGSWSGSGSGSGSNNNGSRKGSSSGGGSSSGSGWNSGSGSGWNSSGSSMGGGFSSGW